MKRTKWSRRRAADRPPSKTKRAKYDQGNAYAAAAILGEPAQHPKFMVDWAERFTRHRAAESTEVDKAQRKGGQMLIGMAERGERHPGGKSIELHDATQSPISASRRCRLRGGSSKATVTREVNSMQNGNLAKLHKPVADHFNK